MAIQESTDRVIEVPATTAWPMIMALGVMLSCAGLVTSVVVSVVGGVLAISGAVGWFRETDAGEGGSGAGSRRLGSTLERRCEIDFPDRDRRYVGVWCAHPD